ncbi:MAG TPA: iron ABC transporter permease [Candidatus Binatia bacterium]|jgi:iron(III) transport system permease protein|nr:iron ABC transporter permease [Candidatus Binatia bacterium]
MSSWLHRHDLSPANAAVLLFLWFFFIAFMLYPLSYVFSGAFFTDEGFSLIFFKLMLSSSNYVAILANSVNLGLAVTLFTTLLSLPLAFLLVRYDFPGKGLLNGLILIPMVLPPFVGAIGMRQLLARFGSINLLLLEMGVIDQPIDWLGGGFWAVVLLEVLHLYPIMYLNLAAALANVDPNLEEAAKNMGASGFKLFRTVTFPLMLPGYFAGAIIVFIWAFTDLGTPLIFEYRDVIAVQIFNMVTDLHQNPMGYAFVVAVIVLTLFFFYLSKRLLGSTRYEMLGRGHVASAVTPASPSLTVLIYTVVLGISALGIIPHLGVFLTSITGRWFLSVLPSEYTFRFYSEVFSHELALLSIKNSLFLSTLSTLIDIVLGVTIAYLLARKRVPGRSVLDMLAMLPLALPGLVIAFGYVAAFSATPLDARINPVPLLVIAYAVRRLPYMVRAAYAGFQQSSVVLEEAAMNLGASPLKTLYQITFPLVFANLVAGAVLSFSFAMLEVSDSLILALKEQHYPITKAIYALLGRIADGPYIASAMGMLGLLLLAGSLFLAGRFFSRRMGELFRA